MLLPSWYPALPALHIIFMVTFFSGTFYLLRVLVLHRQALGRPEPERSILAGQFARMVRVPLYVVAWPSLLLLVLTGAWMAWLRPALLAEAWLQAKLGLTALLFAYHLVNQRLCRKLGATGGWGLLALRAWAQGAVLMLLIAVFLSTFREVQGYIGILGLLVLALIIWTAVRGNGTKTKERHAEGGGQHT